MERSATAFIALSIFLIIGVLIAGCSDSLDPAASGGTPETVTTTTAAAALYSSGDIVWMRSGSSSPAWLVVSYDSANDSYARALIYQNADGTWGYRKNSATELATRALMEKVYPVKLGHIPCSSVPTVAPAIVSTVAATPTPQIVSTTVPVSPAPTPTKTPTKTPTTAVPTTVAERTGLLQIHTGGSIGNDITVFIVRDGVNVPPIADYIESYRNGMADLTSGYVLVRVLPDGNSDIVSLPAAGYTAYLPDKNSGVPEQQSFTINANGTTHITFSAYSYRASSGGGCGG
jgi:hypothetical protein